MDYKHTFAYTLLKKFESLRERVGQHAAALEVCPIPAFIVARTGSPVYYVNPAFRRLLAIDEKRLQNSTDSWLTCVHEEDRVVTRAFWENFVAKVVDGITVAHVHRYTCPTYATGVPATTYFTGVCGNGIIGYLVPSCHSIACPSFIPTVKETAAGALQASQEDDLQ